MFRKKITHFFKYLRPHLCPSANLLRPLSNKSSFTLMELLLVVGILAIIATVTILVLNPVAFIMQARDSKRLAELQSLNKSLNLFILDRPGDSTGSPNTVYVSLPSDQPDCSDLGLPPLPTGWSYHCVAEINLKNIDGTGWMPVNFNLLSYISSLSNLPVDPTNATSGGRYYTYVTGGSWEMTAVLESEKYNNEQKKDKGQSNDFYETGTHIGLTPRVQNFIPNGDFSNCSGIPSESGSNPTNDIILLIENPGNSDCVLRQTGATTEYEIHFEAGTQIQANKTYCMTAWVAYTADWNGQTQIFHARWYDGLGNPFTSGGAGNLSKTSNYGGLSWQKRYLTFTTPSTVNGGFNWYLGYSAQNTAGYRYLTNISLTEGSLCPALFGDF